MTDADLIRSILIMLDDSTPPLERLEAVLRMMDEEERQATLMDLQIKADNKGVN